MFVPPLDPSVVVLLLLAAGCGALVWAGRLDAWLGHDAPWTVLLWPAPVVTVLLPVLATPVWFLIRAAGLVRPEGGLRTGAIYLAVVAVVWGVAVLWPPRWLLPGWARRRVVALPVARAAPRPEAVPALHVVHGRGHGSRARWAWHVDAVPGFVWRDGDTLRFRALGEVTDGVVRTWLDDALEDVDRSDCQTPGQEPAATDAGDDEHRLTPPPGGWWTRRSLDVEVAALDRWRIRATRPWRDDGLVTLEVEGRGAVRLWVAEVSRLRRWLPRPRTRTTGVRTPRPSGFPHRRASA